MTELKEDTKNFLSMLEGYHQQCKMLHWSSSKMSQHKLIDDIDGSILGYEDSLAEQVMGIVGQKFGIGDLKTLLPNSKELGSMLNELIGDIKEYKGKCKSNDGIVNILDDFTTDVNKWKYLMTFD